MLPASRAITVSRTSKAMRTAVKKADAFVPLCGRETKTSSLCYACYTSKTAALRSTEAVSMVEATANFLSASLVELDLEISKGITCTSIRWQRHCVSTPPLNRSTLQISVGRKEEGEGGEAGEGGRCGDGKEGRQKEGGQSVRGGVEGQGVTCGDAWQVLAGNGLGEGFRH